MVAPKRIVVIILFLFCVLSIFHNPHLTEAIQYNLTTAANPTQGGAVLPDCPAGCPYNSDAQVQLIAVPSNGYVFNDWSGNCAGTNPLTTVTMTGAESCVANFLSCGNLPLMRGVTQYPTFDEAYAGAVNNDTIRALATSLATTLRLNSVAITLEGGNNCGYTSPPPSFTLIQGQMIISTGAVTAENMIIMPVVFSQNDLTGDWDAIQFATGANPGWVHWLASIDSKGSITITSFQNSAGGTTPPPAGSIVASIDSGGIVTTSGTNGDPTFSGSMSSDKTLIIATQTSGGGGSYFLYVLRKRVTGVIYSSADIDNINFAFHALHSGGGSAWAYGTAQTDGSGNVTILTDYGPSGAITPPPGGTLQVDANGIVTATNNTFYGLMTIDKKLIFNIVTSDSTPPQTYRFAAFLLTGQTFIEADLAGIYDFRRVDSGTSPRWARGTFDVDTSGSQTYEYYLDSSGSTTLPSADVLTIDSSGAITKSTTTSFHAQMAYNKNLFVRTQNQGTGTYGLAISIK